MKTQVRIGRIEKPKLRSKPAKVVSLPVAAPAPPPPEKPQEPPWSVRYVTPRQVPTVWPIAVVHLSKVLPYTYLGKSLGDVKKELEQGKGMLWIALDANNGIRAALICWVVGPNLRIPIMGGDGLAHWHDAMAEQLLAYCQQYKLRLTMGCRPSVMRLFRRIKAGWKIGGYDMVLGDYTEQAGTAQAPEAPQLSPVEQARADQQETDARGASFTPLASDWERKGNRVI